MHCIHIADEGGILPQVDKADINRLAEFWHDLWKAVASGSTVDWQLTKNILYESKYYILGSSLTGFASGAILSLSVPGVNVGVACAAGAAIGAAVYAAWRGSQRNKYFE